MEVYVKIEFPLTVGRYGMTGATISGEQYLPYIQSISNLSLNLGDDHSFEVSNVNILFDDIDGHFRDRFADDIDKNIQDSLVTFYQSDGTKIATLKIWDYKFISDSGFEITCTNKIGEMWNTSQDKITLENFPATPTDSIGEIIPDFYGIVPDFGKGGLKIWQVRGNNYLIANNVDEVVTLQAAYLEDGTDITAGCAVVAGTSYTFISYGGVTDPDYIYVSATRGGYSAGNPQDVLEQILNKFVDFNSGNYTTNAALDTFLENSVQAGTLFRYYAITTDIVGRDILKDFCDSYNVDWIINSDNEIEIKYIDINNLTSSYTIQDDYAKITPFSSSVDPEEFVNKVFTRGHYNPSQNSFAKQYIFDEFESQAQFGTKPETIDAKFLKTDESIIWAAKYYTMLNKHPRQRAYIQMNTDDWFSKSLEAGDIIDFKHPDDRLQGSANIYYQIRKVNINFMGNIVDLELWDIDYLRSIDKEINLLIQSNMADSYLDHYDFSMTQDGTGCHVLVPALSVSHQDTQTLFQRSSVYNWGFRRISTAGTAEWDIFNSLTESATLSCYVYPTDWSATYTTSQPIFTHYQSATEYWSWRFGPGAPGSSGLIQLTIQSAAGGTGMIGTTVNPINTWVHVALCKVGTSMGLYVNGVQEAFLTLPRLYNFAGTFYIFGNNPLSRYLQGYVAEAFVTNNNFYSAAPVVGLTDTFTPYWHPKTQSAEKLTLTVYNPREDDDWKIGNTYRIRWNIPGINTVIQLWNAALTIKIADITTGGINKEYYDWNTTGIAANSYRIVIADSDGNIADTSDVFTISA